MEILEREYLATLRVNDKLRKKLKKQENELNKVNV